MKFTLRDLLWAFVCLAVWLASWNDYQHGVWRGKEIAEQELIGPGGNGYITKAENVVIPVVNKDGKARRMRVWTHWQATGAPDGPGICYGYRFDFLDDNSNVWFVVGE